MLSIAGIVDLRCHDIKCTPLHIETLLICGCPHEGRRQCLAFGLLRSARYFEARQEATVRFVHTLLDNVILCAKTQGNIL